MLRHSTSLSTALGAASSLILAACSAPGTDGAPGSDGAPIRTDRQVAARVVDTPQKHVEIDIPMTFVNRSDETAYLIGCRHPSMPILQKRVGNAWKTAYVPVELQCLSPAWEVRSGDSYVDTLHVYASFPGQNAAPTFDAPEVPGMYRLIRAVYADKEGKQMLPDSLRVSDPFEVTLGR